MKGNKAQGSIGSEVSSNTDPGQRTSQRSKALRSRVSGLETVCGCNGEKATNVVTQSGCCEGKHFEGCEVRVRERHGGPYVMFAWRLGDWAGNDSNPMAGSRVQQTYKAACGANRRSWEEQQGRKMCRVWQRNTEDKTLIEYRVWTGRMTLESAEGRSLENHMRGSLTWHVNELVLGPEPLGGSSKTARSGPSL